MAFLDAKCGGRADLGQLGIIPLSCSSRIDVLNSSCRILFQLLIVHMKRNSDNGPKTNTSKRHISRNCGSSNSIASTLLKG